MNIKETLENAKNGEKYIQALKALQNSRRSGKATRAETAREIAKTEREQKEFEKVLEYVGTINERYKTILYLHIFERKTFEQIAEKMQYDERHIYRIYKKAIQAAEMAYKAKTTQRCERISGAEKSRTGCGKERRKNETT